MKRGQTALEYLVTYGWAILVIVIIAAILWYFGVFNPSKWTQEKQCGGFSSLQCMDFKVNSTGVLQIKLGNKAGVGMTNVMINNGTTTTNASCTTPIAANKQT
ncbi:MAG: hypothetical protein AB1626_05315, partial [Candidatus Micrarchaeota archaeon]